MGGEGRAVTTCKPGPGEGGRIRIRPRSDGLLVNMAAAPPILKERGEMGRGRGRGSNG